MAALAAAQTVPYDKPPITPTVTPQPVLATTEVNDHKPAHVAPATSAPLAVSLTEPVSFSGAIDLRGAATVPSATPPAPAAATTPTQDIAALVDRISEARAAAAPQTVRAALMHEDFGSVSLNFRTEASHIHVTLGSADPGFAPAVQAAAAASLANNTAGDEPHSRRDAPQQQPSAPAQDTAARNDPSSQQQAQRERSSTGDRAPAHRHANRQGSASAERATPEPAPSRRGGIYA